MNEDNVLFQSEADSVESAPPHESFDEKHPVVVTKDGVAIPVGNIWKEKQLYSILFERGELPLEKYITTRFSGGKLDPAL